MLIRWTTRHNVILKYPSDSRYKTITADRQTLWILFIPIYTKQVIRE